MKGYKIALVLGRAGNIGSATVAAFLDLDDVKNVIIISQSREIETVRTIVGQCADNILGFVGELTSDKEVEAIKKKVTKNLILASHSHGHIHMNSSLFIICRHTYSVLEIGP